MAKIKARGAFALAKWRLQDGSERLLRSDGAVLSKWRAGGGWSVHDRHADPAAVKARAEAEGWSPLPVPAVNPSRVATAIARATRAAAAEAEAACRHRMTPCLPRVRTERTPTAAEVAFTEAVRAAQDKVRAERPDVPDFAAGFQALGKGDRSDPVAQALRAAMRFARSGWAGNALEVAQLVGEEWVEETLLLGETAVRASGETFGLAGSGLERWAAAFRGRKG